MERVYERCCGLDVHKGSVTACVHVPKREGGRGELVESFQTMTADLLALRDWLQGLGVTHVAMEASGVYWKPVWYLLEDDFELLLCNAGHVKNVPGAQDRCVRCAVAVPAARARASASELRAAQAGPRAA
jgi:transposase